MIINIKVKPNSGESKIEKISDNEYVAFVMEKAEDNKANKELINLLAREFNVSYRKIKIKNPKSRKKMVEIVL